MDQPFETSEKKMPLHQNLRPNNNIFDIKRNYWAIPISKFKIIKHFYILHFY